MERDSELWSEVNPSRFPWEREGLAFIRDALPPSAPYRGWANVEFVGDDGSINEIDCLVVGRTGIFLVELKGHPGRMSGNAHSWRWTPPEPGSTTRTIDNPLLAADRKAKKLKSLLVRQKALRGRPEIWIEPVVFLTDAALDVQLLADGRTRVFGRGVPPVSPNGVQLPNLADLLRGNLPVVAARGDRPARAQRAVDRPLSAAIAEAVAQSGIRPSQRHRRVGDYDLGDLLDEDRGWQDWEATHRAMPQVHKRIRVWLAESTHTAEERDRLVRAAHREYRLLEGVQHPSIIRPLDVREHDYGPALVFDHDPSAVRLDRWLEDRGDRLSLDTRLHVVREIAEALAHAHGRGLFHRALSPRSIFVSNPERAEPTVRVGDWQTGAREQPGGGDSTGLAGTSHVVDLVTATATAYLAPETFVVPDAPGRQLDVFALGAVAFHVLTGRPPASDAAELRGVLRDHGGLELSAAQDAPAEALRLLIREATAADVAERMGTIEDFLAGLDLALDELTGAPDTVDEPVDPLRANQGDVLEGGWIVRRRLGKGSSAVALLAERAGRSEVLKVALDPEHHERLRGEYEVLQIARHKGIAAAYDLDQIAGRLVLHLELAGERTLAQVLRQDGRLGLDLLQRWGDDLLEVVTFLEQDGIAHRDIKPDNLGIKARKPRDELHLVLFDFSLARTPPEQIRAGTPGYLDPFLDERPARRWDIHAERWAAAVTLYEMATGTRPRWGEGVDPASIPGLEVTVDQDLLDPAVADALGSFFRVALSRDPSDRFGTVDEMRRAWQESFLGADQPVLTLTENGQDTESSGVLAAAVSTATLATPLVELGLTPRALDALSRSNVHTVDDLLRTPYRDVMRLRAVGDRTRREVAAAARALRARFDVESSESVTGDEADATAFSVDRIAALLVPKATSANTTEVAAIRLLLGLDDAARLTDGGTLPSWPSQADVAGQLDVTRARVNQIIGTARERWRRMKALTGVRNELHEALVAAGRVMGAGELAELLLATRGSSAEEPLRTQRARAIVRAAVEADQILGDPRWAQRRRADRLVIADDTGDVEGLGLADYALRLGEVADKLVGADPLPALATVVEALREVPLPAGADALPDNRLIRLAAGCSLGAATSSRLDLYPRQMAADRAVRLARAALVGQGTLTVDAVGARVRARYPDAATLPARPALDELLRDAGTGLGIGEPIAAVVGVPHEPGPLSTASPSGTHYMTRAGSLGGDAPPDEVAEMARAFDDRLRHSAATGGFLVLTVEPRRAAGAERRLSESFGAELVSIDTVVIAAMRAQAERAGADWDVVLRADADAPGGGEWQTLQHLVRLVMPDVRAELLARGPVVVATDVGLLARYGHLRILEDLRDHTTGLRTEADSALRTLWIVVPADDPDAMPRVNGEAIAVLGLSQWTPISRDWLANAHRAARSTIGGGDAT